MIALQNRSDFKTPVPVESQSLHYLTWKWRNEDAENFYFENDSKIKINQGLLDLLLQLIVFQYFALNFNKFLLLNMLEFSLFESDLSQLELDFFLYIIEVYAS